MINALVVESLTPVRATNSVPELYKNPISPVGFFYVCFIPLR